MICPRSHSEVASECGLDPGMSLCKGVNHKQHKCGRDRASELGGAEILQTVIVFSKKRQIETEWQNIFSQVHELIRKKS